MCAGGSRKGIRRHVIEEQPVGVYYNVGHQVDAFRSVPADSARYVGTREQAGDRHIATEQDISYGQDPDAIPSDRLERPGQNRSEELAGHECRGTRLTRRIELREEGRDHPDAVLVLRESIICRGLRQLRPGEQVELVCCVHPSGSRALPHHALPLLYHCEHAGCLYCVVRGRPALLMGRESHRHRAYRDHPCTLTEILERVLEHLPVVDAGNQHDLHVCLDPARQEFVEHLQCRVLDRRTDEPCTYGRVHGMDRHMERRQALGEDAFDVGIVHVGQRDEVAGKER